MKDKLLNWLIEEKIKAKEDHDHNLENYYYISTNIAIGRMNAFAECIKFIEDYEKQNKKAE